MGSIPDPGELTELTLPSFDEFQWQTFLMTSCTLLWKELSDHLSSLEQNLLKKSEAIKLKIQTLEHETKASLEQREVSIRDIFEVALGKVKKSKEDALKVLKRAPSDDEYGEMDDGEGLLMNFKSLCLKMDSGGLWRFVTSRKKELEALRSQLPLALDDYVDPAKFVLEAISEVFPVDKRVEMSDRERDGTGFFWFGDALERLREGHAPNEKQICPVLGSVDSRQACGLAWVGGQAKGWAGGHGQGAG